MKNPALNKALVILLSTNGVILISGAMLGPIYALYVDNLGGSLMDASFAGGVFALAAGLTSLVTGKFADRTKNKSLIVVFGYLLMSCGFLSYLWVNSVYSLFVIQALIGFGEAVYSPAFDSLYSGHLNKRHSATQWGMWESMNYFTGAFGAVLGGITVTLLGFQALFVIMSLLCAASAFYIFFLTRNLLESS